MRIISGEYRGRRLHMIQDNSIRPATDRVKGSIFNMLQNRLSLSDVSVLDLFAGSGSLAFESLSRGAGSAVFVDSGKPAIEIINANVDVLHCEESCTVIHADAMQYIEHCRDSYDLIFADPPYRYNNTHRIPELIFGHKLLNKKGFLIIEHSKETVFEQSHEYRLSVCKEFGATRVSFFVNPITPIAEPES